MNRWLFTVALFLAGCYSANQSKVYHAIGYVRSMWCYRADCYTVFEGEDGIVFGIRTLGIPPLWVGLHGEIEYEYDENYACGCIYKNVKVTRRLP